MLVRALLLCLSIFLLSPKSMADLPHTGVATRSASAREVYNVCEMRALPDDVFDDSGLARRRQ